MTSRSASTPDRIPRQSSDTVNRTSSLRKAPSPRQSRELTVQEAYFGWLYDKIRDRLSLVTVCQLMHQVEFFPLVPHDENRVAVAAGLRNEFQRYAGSLGPGEAADLMSPDASVFEVLIGLAGQGEDMIPLGVRMWFHIFLENLGLTRYTDDQIEGRAAFQVEKIIHRFNNRQYRPNGRGGIFPLSHPRCDQREIELWYQMGLYITQEGMY